MAWICFVTGSFGKSIAGGPPLGRAAKSLGRLLIQAISTGDYPLNQGCILFILVVFVLINLMVDVLYAYIDPRIDYG